jgi:nucleoid DNA-binding protein
LSLPQRRMAASKKPPTKAEIVSTAAEKCGCSKTDVEKVLEAFEQVMVDSLRRHGSFTFSPLLKATTTKVAAKPARMGTKPGTSEQVMFKATPAKTRVTLTPLTGLKNAVNA